MIEIRNLMKSFGKIRAVDGISLTIPERQVFGLIGTNGAGKSTLLRMIAGVLEPDGGELLVDGEEVYDRPAVKQDIFFISDEPYFFRNAAPEDMQRWYADHYPEFDRERFHKLIEEFGLGMTEHISNFSKGMKKQLAVILGLCAGTRYLLCDETLDGLDPVMRQGVKSLFASDMMERGLTPVIASHNLRELEDICDEVGLLHRGGVLLSENLDEMKLGLTKVQVVFRTPEDREKALEGFKILTSQKAGRLETLILRAEKGETEARFRAAGPVYFELLPLNLEEIFISETEAVGYDIKKFILS